MIGPKLPVELPARSFSAAALWHYLGFPTEPDQSSASLACRNANMRWIGRWRKRAEVSAYSYSLTSPPKCSTCLEPFYVMLRTPVELAPGFDRVTYRCATCGVEETRPARRAD